MFMLIFENALRQCKPDRMTNACNFNVKGTIKHSIYPIYLYLSDYLSKKQYILLSKIIQGYIFFKITERKN